MTVTEPAGRRLRHRPLIDGVRGYAMVLVVCYHLGGAVKAQGGWVAMDLFFVLSGFLITALLVGEYHQHGRIDLVEFLRRRARRLGPALLAMVAAVFVATWVWGAADAFPNLRGDGLATLFYVANWHLIETGQSYFTSFGQSPLRHTWSLAIEEQFYLVWPVLFLGLSRLFRGNRHRLVVLLAAAAGASAWWMHRLTAGTVDVSRAYYGTDSRAQSVLVGAILALLIAPDLDGPAPGTAARRRLPDAALQVIGLAGTAGIVFAALAVAEDNRSLYRNGGFLLVSGACAAVVYAAVHVDRGPLAWIYANPVIRHFGALSYSGYLWHWPVIVLVAPPRVHLDPLPLGLVQAGLSLALAEASYWGLERPIHRRRWTFRGHGGRALLGSVAVVAALVLVVTAGATAVTPPSSGGGQRASGNPDADRRVLVLGDSLAWILSSAAPADAAFEVHGAFRAHCDIVGDRIYTGSSVDAADPACPTWPTQWRDALAGRLPDIAGDPDVIVVSLGLRQLFDLDVDGRRVPVGSPEWERRYRQAVERAVATIRGGSDAPVLWLDVPCYRWAAAGTNGEEHDATRIATVNRVLADVLADHRGFHLMGYRDRVCDGTTSDATLRPDGAHLTESATVDFWRWLAPTIARPPGD